MITLLHCNINKINDAEIDSYLSVLPSFMRGNIMRYKNNNDRKSRLLARLMLYDALEKNDEQHLIHNWKTNDYQKPFIDGWHEFNISHSGEQVVFAYGSCALGVDIEKKEDLNFYEILNNFHDDEQQKINESLEQKETFYELWSKKEALLKAIGIGISRGKDYSCIGDIIEVKEKKWRFHSFQVSSDYYSCLCIPAEEQDVNMAEFVVNKING